MDLMKYYNLHINNFIVPKQLKELHWLPVEQRITFKVLRLTFKVLNNLAPPYLSQLIVSYNPTRNLSEQTFIRSTECAPEELWGQGLFGRCPKALE